MSHTPTPWDARVDRTGENRCSTAKIIEAATERAVAKLAADTKYALTAGNAREEEERCYADAAHIVHCVNVHDQLVAALDMCRQRFAGRLLNLEMNGLASPFEINELRQVLNQITQALAAAEKGA